ncbi:MAG: BamA/TamA family outer membrane protein [Bacteroidetes bacterium]|nr:BamA/TamA family outer membrane protein [Bacteroidota bacterium]
MTTFGGLCFRVSRLFLVVILLSLTGCLGTRFLKKDQKLLYKQKISGVSREDRRATENLFQQSPNRKFPFIPWAPYVWLHQLGKNSYDSAKYVRKKEKQTARFKKKIEGRDPGSNFVTRKRFKNNRKLAKWDRNIKEGNLLMRWGEPVSVYDSALTRSSIAQFKLYLQAKGYFKSRLYFETKTVDKRVRVNYTIRPGAPSIIDSIRYIIPQDSIGALVASASEETLVNKGDKYDQEAITKERERLYNLMVDNGYFEFTQQYINFEVDTISLPNRRIILKEIIHNKEDGTEHKIFRIDSVNFITDANIIGSRQDRTIQKHGGVNFMFYEDTFNRRILISRLFIQEDSLFRRSNTLSTQRQLANMDMFKFINVHYDTTGGKFVSNVFTSPLDKYQTSGEVGVNVSQGLPGPFVNGSVKDRNLFGGLEILSLSGRFGIEGVASASNDKNVYQSTELGINASLLFPQFLFPLSKKWEQRVKGLEPKTTFNTGSTLTNRPEYDRRSFLGSVSYTWTNEKRKIYNFSPAEIIYINSDIKSKTFEEFLDAQLARGNLLKNTFKPSYVSSMSFSAINNIGQYGNSKERSSFFRYNIESGGTFLNFIGSDNLSSKSLEFYQYLKFNVDFRGYNPISSSTVFSFRINLGLAIPYGENNILPYEKYFFSGGSNGIRAWRPRRLGPGSYTPLDEDGNYTDNFEQQGEILMESSLELRHDIIGFVDGAFFIDMGNIWTLRNDPTREGAQFEVDRFFREIAIGTGYGIRFDFSFLLLRFDTGLKIYDPARDRGNRFILDKNFNDSKFQASDNLVINIGIGYPF